ncbi:divalent-cation tolerance protein CutA [Dokdonella soli]|uniref:Divalent-cation tolerance protein CutA n=1 Tax=Dokdonella soli TaxID=529810 RepID=A0ABP3TZN5_9GAMM
MSVVIAHCTCPDEESAARIARALVDERLAACVQAIPSVTSTYRWNDAVHAEREVLLLIKTTRARFAALKSRLPALHPYESPELIAVDAVDGLDRYLGWVETETESQ